MPRKQFWSLGQRTSAQLEELGRYAGSDSKSCSAWTAYLDWALSNRKFGENLWLSFHGRSRREHNAQLSNKWNDQFRIFSRIFRAQRNPYRCSRLLSVCKQQRPYFFAVRTSMPHIYFHSEEKKRDENKTKRMQRKKHSSQHDPISHIIAKIDTPFHTPFFAFHPLIYIHIFFLGCITNGSQL